MSLGASRWPPQIVIRYASLASPMYNVNPPPFPEFTDDEYHHLSSIRLPAFAGMQITNGPYGAVSDPGASRGDTHAAADRELAPDVFRMAVAWVIQHNTELRPRLFSALVD